VHGIDISKENAKNVMEKLCPLMNVFSKDKGHKTKTIDENG